MSFLKDQIHGFISKGGLKAGLQPVEGLEKEEERVEELLRLDVIDKDLTNEREFNNVTQLACFLTGRSKSTINLLDDVSQHSKNTQGFNAIESFMTKEMPRSVSICQFVLAAPKEQMIIEDLKKDTRTQNFHKMPMAPNIQFYAGTPIITKRGYTVGTLCVFDEKPGTLIHSQKEGLRLLSDQVSSLLEQISPKKKTEEEQLGGEKSPIEASYYSAASILFTDFVDFTQLSENIQPGELIETLDQYFSSFDLLMDNHGIKKVKTIGDSYMAVAGIPEGKPGHARNACAAGLDIIKMVDGINMQRTALGKDPWKIRVGVHTGPVIAGFSGSGFDVWGDSVNIASRLESTSEGGRLHISEETKLSLDQSSGITDRGEIELKNKGMMRTYFLDNLA